MILARLSDTTRHLVALAILTTSYALGANAQAPADGIVATLIKPNARNTPINPAQPEIAAIMAHLRKKEYDKALQATTKLIDSNPKDPVGYNLQGTVYLVKNDAVNARKSFMKALEVQPDYLPPHLTLARLDLQEKNLADARKHYQAVLAKDPKNVLAMAGMARLAALNRNNAESLSWLERAKKENPGELHPILLLANSHFGNKDYAKALAELGDAQRIRPDDPSVLELLGQVQLAADQKADAVATYKKLVALRPQSAVANRRLAIAQLAIDDTPGATASLNKAVQLQPDYADAVHDLAALEVQAGRIPQAVKLAKQLQKARPESPAGLVLEGDVLMKTHQYVDAANAYEKAFSMTQVGPLVTKLHLAQTKAGNAKDANARIQKWLTAHPKDVQVRQYLAQEHMRSGQNKLAIDQYQIVLKNDPKNVAALNNLANLYQREKDPRALKLAEEAYKLNPDSASIVDTLGWLMFEQGNSARALELLQRASAQAPKNNEIRFHLAAALVKSGDKARARRELEILLAGDHEFPQRAAAQALLKQL